MRDPQVGKSLYRVERISINLLDPERYDFKSLQTQAQSKQRKSRRQPEVVRTVMWDVLIRDPVGAALSLIYRRNVSGACAVWVPSVSVSEYPTDLFSA